MSGPVFIAGDRIALRPIEAEDIDVLHEHINDPRVWRSLGRSRPFTRTQDRDFFEAEVSDDDAVHLVVADGSTPLGLVSLVDIEGESGTAELGYWLGPEHHGQGYGTEAAALLVSHAFDRLRLHRLSATVFAFNEPSVRLLERLGFVREGVQRESVFVDGEHHDTYWYGLLESEWRERAARD